MVAVVDHLTGHAAIDADVLARDEACLVNHIDYGSLLAELIGNASANATGTASNDDYSVFECIGLHHL